MEGSSISERIKGDTHVASTLRGVGVGGYSKNEFLSDVGGGVLPSVLTSNLYFFC